jgi:hypothetical protein
MAAQCGASFRSQKRRFLAWGSPTALRQDRSFHRCGLLLLGAATLLCVGLTPPRPAAAWWPDWPIPPQAGYSAWGLAPWGPTPFHGPPRGFRFSRPSGAPLSYEDPVSGTTYCWSERSGGYFVCAYTPSRLVSPNLPPPPPPSESAAQPAPGILLFRLPQDAEATVNDVPIGLSAGVGVQSLPPGQYRVALRVSGGVTEYTVTMRSHKILMVTKTGIVATEP